MTSGKHQPFYWRAFVTFYVVISFVIIVSSGLVLYIAPPGRISNWSEWTFVSITKANWQAVHTIFTFLFVVAAAFHIYFNWRVIVAYLKTKLGEGIRRRRELALSSAVVFTVLVLTIGGVPPFETVMTVGETLKNSWATSATEPPVPHAELWTLAQLAGTAKIPLDQVLANLKQAGITPASAEVTLASLADDHKLTPQAVYKAAMRDTTPAPIPLAEGGGYGLKTVREICEQIKVPVSTGLERLRQQGIEATPESNMRELATRAGKQPIDLVKILQP
jgi:hypothetical protein